MQGVNHPLCASSRAKVMGLVNRDDLNGKVVKLEALQPSGRWQVTCEKSGESILIKPANLHTFSDALGYGTTARNPRDTPMKDLPCNGCGEVGGNNKACVGCRIAIYCSKECQTKHWPDHKVFCKQAKKNQELDAQDLSALDIYHKGVAAAQRRGQEREAIDFYRASIVKDPFLFVAVANLASMLRRVGDNEGALTVLLDAVRRGAEAPQSAVAYEPRAFYIVHETLGNAFMSNHDVQRAMASYRQAMKIAEALRLREPGAYIQMGACYDLLGDHAASLRTKRENAERFPGAYICHYNLGCELRTQQPMAFDTAAASFRKALTLSDGRRDADVHAMLGVTLLDEAVVRRSSPADAIACFEEALRRDRHHPAAQRDLQKAKAYAMVADLSGLNL